MSSRRPLSSAIVPLLVSVGTAVAFAAGCSDAEDSGGSIGPPSRPEPPGQQQDSTAGAAPTVADPIFLAHPEGIQVSQATAVNPSGAASGGWVTADGVQHAVRWADDAGEGSDLAFGARDAWAFAINDAGDVAGYRSDDGAVFTPLVWQSDGGVTTLRLDGLPAVGFATAYGINDHGATAGAVFIEANGRRQFVAVAWDAAGAPTRLPAEGEARAFDINDAGRIVGSRFDSVNLRRDAVRWTPAPNGVAALDLEQADAGAPPVADAFAINESGVIVGAVYVPYPRPNPNPFTFTPAQWSPDGTLTRLRLPDGADGGIAYAINEAGQIGGVVWGTQGTVPVLWTDGIPQELPGTPNREEAGWPTLAGLSTRWVAGWGPAADGTSQALLWRFR